ETHQLDVTQVYNTVGSGTREPVWATEIFLRQWDDDGLAKSAIRGEAGFPELALNGLHELERNRVTGIRGFHPHRDVAVRAQIQRRIPAQSSRDPFVTGSMDVLHSVLAFGLGDWIKRYHRIVAAWQNTPGGVQFDIAGVFEIFDNSCGKHRRSWLREISLGEMLDLSRSSAYLGFCKGVAPDQIFLFD